MNHPKHRPPAFVRRQPELPAFCRTRRQQLLTVTPSSLRRLEMLLWLGLTLQVTIVFLVVAGPVPSALHPRPARLSNGLVRR